MNKNWRFYSVTFGDDFDDNVMVVSFIIGDPEDGNIITKRIVGIPTRSNWAGILNEAIDELMGECVQIKHSDLKRMYDENYVGENG